MKTFIVLLLIALSALSGCSSLNGEDYKQYVAAQTDANRLATESQKPLVRLTAQPGQAITGLAGLEVYMPVASQQIQQARPNEWVGILGQGISVLGAVAGLKVSGDAAIGLANAVGDASTRGYANVQAPQANVSTVTTTTDASNRSTSTGAVMTDASNRSTTTGAVTTSTTTSTTTDSSTHSTPTSTITGSYNPASTTTSPLTPAVEVPQR